MIEPIYEAATHPNALADGAGTAYTRIEMEKLKILSAAATLNAFTVQLLESLSGEDQRIVEQLITTLLEQGRIKPSKPIRRSADKHKATYVWTAGGAMAARAEVQAARTNDTTTAPISDGTEIERYEDPFTSALDVARSWVEDAEGSFDEETLGRNLSMARAEVRALRRFLHDQPASSVEEIEELARRLELLAARPPVEAFRSKIRRSIYDALRNAARHVPLENRTAGSTDTDPDMAFVFNATRTVSDTASQVGRTVEQIGGACVIFQMADVSPRDRQLAFEALGSFFTGPGSAKTKVFIIIDSSGDARSKSVLKELVTFFGNSDRLTDLLARGSGDQDKKGDWAFEPTLFLSAIATPSDDWLPRGLLKHFALQKYVNHMFPRDSNDLARVALNDPVVFDCVAAGIERARATKTQFAYHRVEMDIEHGAVIRGLVRGSFAGIAPTGEPYATPKDIRLLASGS